MATFSVSGPSSVNEGDSASFAVTISGSISSATTVYFSTLSGTASYSAGDYGYVVDQPVTFNPGGVTTQYVSVPTYSDTQIEGNENFRGGVYSAGNTLLASSGYVTLMDKTIAAAPATFSVSGPSSVNEGDSASFAVTVNGSISSATTVYFSTLSGTASYSAGDYGYVVDQPVTFSPGGVTTQYVSVPTYSDTQIEGNENFRGGVYNAGNTLLASSGYVTLVDKTTAAVPATFSVSGPSSVNEGDSASFAVTISGTISTATTVYFSTLYSTASSADGDYGGINNQAVTFYPGGSTTQTVSVPTYSDTQIEGNENFRGGVYNAGGTQLSTSGYVTLVDKTAVAIPATYSVSGPSSVNESDSASFAVSISGSISSATTVYFSTLSGTASYSAGDYGYVVDQPVTFNPGGATTQYVSVPTYSDTQIEGNENFRGGVYNASNTQLASSGYVTLVDTTPAAAPATYSVSGPSSVNEGDSASFAVAINGTISSATTVYFSTLYGTASSADGDYGGVVNQALTFSAGGATTQYVSVPTYSDTKIEGNENFRGGVYNASGTQLAVSSYVTLVDTTPAAAPATATTMVLSSTSVQAGTTADEVANIALANVGKSWAADGCAAFVWGVTNLAGLPFFDLSDKTTNHDPRTPQDVGYVVPHSAGMYSGTADVAGDGWLLVSSATSASQLSSILQRGDVVRIYKDGNTNESSGNTSNALSHSFIVVSNTDGNVQVADNWSGTTISQHSLSDITNSWAPKGQFAAAFVSRIDANWVATSINQSTLQGNGFGDWSSLGSAATPVTDDFLNTTSTTGTIAVGGTATGNIETSGDTDWFKTTLTAGHTYQLDLEGSATGQGTLSNPFLRLRDSAGNSLTSADDGGTGFNSRFTFTATSSETYYLSTGSSTASGTGTYKLSVADMPSSAPSFSVSGPSSVNEGDSANFAVTISGSISSQTTVYFSTLAGTASYGAGDYASVTDRAVTFTPGEATTQTVAVPTLTDNTVEGNETFKGVVYATSGAFSNGVFLATSNEITLVDKTNQAPTGQDVITIGEQHLGQDYFWRYDNNGTWVTMSNAALGNPSYSGPWDCAEFVSYCVYRAYGLKYGLISKDTASQESSAGQWLTDATTLKSQFTEITLSQARNIPGVILIAKSGGHVAISMGDGSQVLEANVDWNPSIGTYGTYYSDRAIDLDSISHGATQGAADSIAVNASQYDTAVDNVPAGVDVGDVRTSTFNWSSQNYRAFEINAVSYGGAVTPTPTPNPTGDTPSGGRIFLEGKDAGSFFGAEYGHLYLVYQDSNGQEQVIRGGQAGGTWFDPFGPIIIEAGRPLSGSSDSRNGQSAADHGQTPIDLGDRLASDVWTIMIDFANDIGAQQIAYDIIPITNNSNTVAVSVLRAVGVPLPNPLPLASQLNYRGSDHLLGFDYSLAGTGHSDILVGYTGNDQLSGGAGNDTLNGGSGTDIAVFSGNLANYTLTKTGSTYTVRANTGTDGTDTVTNVESLKFADMAVNLTVQATAATVATADLHRLEELYVAFFNRVPDADGLAYWIGQFKAGSTINQIAESLYNIGASAQYSSLTGFSTSMSNTDFIHVFYKNVLGRPAGADSGGLSYWNDKLTDGSSTRYSLAQDILNSAHTLKGDTTYGSVADLLDNKIVVANKVAVDWGLNYNNDAYTHGVDIAKAVTATSTSAALTLVGISAPEMSLG